MSINLHIEHLIIDGIDIKPHQINKLKLAIESMLKQQLLTPGASSAVKSHHNHKSVRGGSIIVGKNFKPVGLGQQISKAVYRGIGK